MKARRIFVTGIGTGVGKTLAAAVLAEAWHADYWKPVQAGDLEISDTQRVRELISNSRTRCFPEAHRLSQPLSPHAAAQIDGVRIDCASVQAPETNNHLLIEGAGGLLVPLNGSELIIDLIRELEAEVVLISQHYLGSINHTLLSLAVLREHCLPLLGVIFNGASLPSTETAILEIGGAPCLGRMDPLPSVDRGAVRGLAEKFRNCLEEL